MQVVQNKSPLPKKLYKAHIYVSYSRYKEYALRRRALNADGTAKSWPHKYHSVYKIFF